MDSTITFIAITVFKDQLLFLKRNDPPRCWGPPSGHVKIGEAIEDAIEREMMEETGNVCKPLMPVSVWQGIHRGNEVFNVTYVCEMASQKIMLSDEHEDYRWISITDLDSFQKETLLDLKDWPLLIELARVYDMKRNR